MAKMHAILKYWTPDQCAECLNVPNELSVKLWKLLDGIKEEDRKPLGGDGSNGTVELPPDPGSYDKGTIAAVWDKLSNEEQQQINDAVAKDYGG